VAITLVPRGRVRGREEEDGAKKRSKLRERSERFLMTEMGQLGKRIGERGARRTVLGDRGRVKKRLLRAIDRVRACNGWRRRSV